MAIAGPVAGLTISDKGRGFNDWEIAVGIGSGPVTNATLSNLSFTTDPGVSLTNAALVVDFSGNLTMIGCTIHDASGANGAAVLNHGTLAMTNCTVSGNSSSGSGVIANAGTARLTFVTITGNRADSRGAGFSGGGIDNSNFGAGGSLTINDSIVAGNFLGTGSTASDIVGAVAIDSSNNLVGVNTGMTGLTSGVAHNQVGTAASPIDPLLAALADYTGSTPTVALRPGSPARGAGVPIQGVATDQRGQPRGVAVDIGAFQASGNDFALVVNTTNDFGRPGTLTLREAINLANARQGAETIHFVPDVSGTAQTITVATELPHLTAPPA